MKLFARYTRLNLVAMLAVFVIGIGGLFFVFRYILIRQVDEGLETERDENLQYIQRYHRLPPPVSLSDQQISYQEVPRPIDIVYSTIEVAGEQGQERARQLSFPVDLDNKHYQFFISVPLEETVVLLRIIGLVTLGVLALMLLSIFAIHRKLIRYLLQPFYKTIDTVKTYSIAQHAPLQLPATPIDEFSALNQTLNEMAARAQKDFAVIRSFTAQAAHEMQTPLAVLRLRLETLMQSPEINEAQAYEITGIDNSIERLTRLFNSLLLLTKIENHQFPIEEELSFDKIVREKVVERTELAISRSISMRSTLLPATIRCNRYLAEVLVSNLLNNAIRYNYPGGTVEVEVGPGLLKVSNTSHLPGMNEDVIFRPFYRHPDSQQDGNGLGLSIVAQICEVCGFSVKYQFANGVHSFAVGF